MCADAAGPGRRTMRPVSVAVELEDLAARLAEYGPVAFVVTVGDDARPHVVSAEVRLVDGALVADVGKTTAANVERHASATALWPALDGGEYCLIVDGMASAGGAQSERRVAIDPTRAVLHRVAGAPDSVPSCVTVLDRRS